jgi:PKD repeat protein
MLIGRENLLIGMRTSPHRSHLAKLGFATLLFAALFPLILTSIAPNGALKVHQESTAIPARALESSPLFMDRAMADLARGAGPAHGSALTCQLATEGSASCLQAAGARPSSIPTSDWWDLTSRTASTSPTARWGGAMVYDQEDGYVLMFAGGELTGYATETWAYSNATWTQIPTASHPPARLYPSMVWDSALGRALLYGGVDPNGSGPVSDLMWEYGAGVWSYVAASPNPGPRFAAGIVYDVADSALLLVGGANVAGFSQNDTWEFKSGLWTNLSLAHAPERQEGAQMAYDVADGSAVLFGGETDAGTTLNYTWTFYSGAWHNVTTGTHPGDRVSAAMGWDAAHNFVLLTGGYSLLNMGYVKEYSDTWSFVAGQWTNLSTLHSPGGIDTAAATFDTKDGYFFRFGGLISGATPTNNTIAFARPLNATPLTLSKPGEVGIAASFSASLVGGISPFTFTWQLGDGSSPTHGMNPVHTFLTSINATVNLTVVDLVGSTVVTHLTFPVVAHLTATATVSNTNSDSGQTVVFKAVTTGGFGPFNWTWLLPNGASTWGSSLNQRIVATGSYGVNVTALDALGVRSTSSVSVKVHALPITMITASSTSVKPGDVVVMTGDTTGGWGPYTYLWKFGDGVRGSGAFVSHAFATSGAFVVTLLATDSVGGNGSTTVLVQVAAPAGGISTLEYGLIGGIAVVVVIAAAALVMRIRKGRSPPPKSSSKPPAPNLSPLYTPPPPDGGGPAHR